MFAGAICCALIGSAVPGGEAIGFSADEIAQARTASDLVGDRALSARGVDPGISGCPGGDGFLCQYPDFNNGWNITDFQTFENINLSFASDTLDRLTWSEFYVGGAPDLGSVYGFRSRTRTLPAAQPHSGWRVRVSRGTI